MPRVVHLPSSESSSSEEDDSSPTQHKQYNHRPVYRTAAARERGYKDYLTYTQRGMVSFNEDEVYCLTTIIDGKIRKFKKDSRTWLHKSSDKIKNKSGGVENGNFLHNLPTRCSSLNESKNNSDSTKNAANRVHSIVDTIARTTGDTDDLLSSYTEYYMCDNLAAVNSNNRNVPNGLKGDEDYMFIGDSNADLTYEEELPEKTVKFVDLTTQDKNITSSSSNTSQEEGKNLEEKEPSNFSLAVSGSSFHDQESFEHLDLCNESGNSVSYPGDISEISRKLAPAIEIEKESFRENLLDYAVNRSVGQMSEGSDTTCCGNVYKKLRARGGNRKYETECGVQQVTRTRKSQMNQGTSIKSSLRRPKPDKNTNGDKKSDTKRIRFAEDADNQDHPSERSNEICRKPSPEVTKEVSVPSCSKENGGTSIVPSLFVIAGFVLYGMYESSLEQQ